MVPRVKQRPRALTAHASHHPLAVRLRDLRRLIRRPSLNRPAAPPVPRLQLVHELLRRHAPERRRHGRRRVQHRPRGQRGRRRELPAAVKAPARARHDLHVVVPAPVPPAAEVDIVRRGFNLPDHVLDVPEAVRLRELHQHHPVGVPQNHLLEVGVTCTRDDVLERPVDDDAEDDLGGVSKNVLEVPARTAAAFLRVASPHPLVVVRCVHVGIVHVGVRVHVGHRPRPDAGSQRREPPVERRGVAPGQRPGALQQTARLARVPILLRDGHPERARE